MSLFRADQEKSEKTEGAMDGVTSEQIQEAMNQLGPEEGAHNVVGRLHGLVVSVERVHGEPRPRVDQTEEGSASPVQDIKNENVPLSPMTDEVAKAAPNPCTTAFAVAGGLAGLGAVGLGVLIASTDGTVIPVLGYAFPRWLLVGIKDGLATSAPLSSIAAAVAPYVC